MRFILWNKTEGFLNKINQVLPTSCRIQVWIILDLFVVTFATSLKSLCIRMDRCDLVLSTYTLELFQPKFTKNWFFHKNWHTLRVFFWLFRPIIILFWEIFVIFREKVEKVLDKKVRFEGEIYFCEVWGGDLIV